MSRIKVIRTPDGVWVGWPGGARFFAPDRREADDTATGADEVRAPMTARVVKVAVAAGAEVAPDDLLVVLQAMKMEYRLTAPRAGVVARLYCAEGVMVELGATLVTLAPEERDGPEGPEAAR